MYVIRKAESKDIDSCINLLKQVCNVHAKLRPDLFKSGMTKYSKIELEEIFKNESTPVFVYEEDNLVLGYGFCQIINIEGLVHPKKLKSLYIDDICINEDNRGKHIGKKIFDYIINYARDINCYNVTLNVWDGNNAAIKFYNAMGMKVQKTTMEKIL